MSYEGWYNDEIVCFTFTGVTNPSQSQIDIMNDLMLCYLTATGTASYSIGDLNIFINCLVQHGLDPDSEDVLQFLIFLPKETCVNTDELEEDYSNVMEELAPAMTEKQIVCVALWYDIEGEWSIQATEIVICPVREGVLTDDYQVKVQKRLSCMQKYII